MDMSTTQLFHPRQRNIAEERAERMLDLEGQEVCREIMSLGNDREAEPRILK